MVEYQSSICMKSILQQKLTTIKCPCERNEKQNKHVQRVSHCLKDVRSTLPVLLTFLKLPKLLSFHILRLAAQEDRKCQREAKENKRK